MSLHSNAGRGAEFTDHGAFQTGPDLHQRRKVISEDAGIVDG